MSRWGLWGNARRRTHRHDSLANNSTQAPGPATLRTFSLYEIDTTDQHPDHRKPACIPCQRRKARCDGMLPRCSNCQTFNRVCEYGMDAQRNEAMGIELSETAIRKPRTSQATESTQVDSSRITEEIAVTMEPRAQTPSITRSLSHAPKQACYQCRRRKTRCSLETPKCSSCGKYNRLCEYELDEGSQSFSARNHDSQVLATTQDIEMTDPMVFNEGLELTEDVAAELEDFALLVRLGMIDEAHDYMESILWNHMDDFAVFSEMGQFLVDQNEQATLQNLVLAALERRDSRNFDDEQLQRCLGIKFEGGSRFSPRNIDRRFDNCGSSEARQCQDMAFTHLTRSVMSSLEFYHAGMRYLTLLLDHELAWEVVRLFRMMCDVAVSKDSYLQAESLYELYNRIMNWMVQPSSGKDEAAETSSIDFLTCVLHAHLAWVSYTFAFIRTELPCSSAVLEIHRSLRIPLESTLVAFTHAIDAFEAGLGLLRCGNQRGQVWSLLFDFMPYVRLVLREPTTMSAKLIPRQELQKTSTDKELTLDAQASTTKSDVAQGSSKQSTLEAFAGLHNTSADDVMEPTDLSHTRKCWYCYRLDRECEKGTISWSGGEPCRDCAAGGLPCGIAIDFQRLAEQLDEMASQSETRKVATSSPYENKGRNSGDSEIEISNSSMKASGIGSVPLKAQQTRKQYDTTMIRDDGTATGRIKIYSKSLQRSRPRRRRYSSSRSRSPGPSRRFFAGTGLAAGALAGLGAASLVKRNEDETEWIPGRARSHSRDRSRSQRRSRRRIRSRSRSLSPESRGRHRTFGPEMAAFATISRLPAARMRSDEDEDENRYRSRSRSRGEQTRQPYVERRNSSFERKYMEAKQQSRPGIEQSERVEVWSRGPASLQETHSSTSGQPFKPEEDRKARGMTVMKQAMNRIEQATVATREETYSFDQQRHGLERRWTQPATEQSENRPGGIMNTRLVACKFFRKGNCQAGGACPFFHDTDSVSVQTPCKYFMKGNCKFGMKCALGHYLPNGQRVNTSQTSIFDGRQNTIDSIEKQTGDPQFECVRLREL